MTWTPRGGAHRERLAHGLGAARTGAIVTSVTSPPCASTSLSAASSAYSSFALTTAGDGGPIEPPVRPEALTARGGIGNRLDEDDDVHEQAVS